jgi:hypothetical protein
MLDDTAWSKWQLYTGMSRVANVPGGPFTSVKKLKICTLTQKKVEKSAHFGLQFRECATRNDSLRTGRKPMALACCWSIGIPPRKRIYPGTLRSTPRKCNSFFFGETKGGSDEQMAGIRVVSDSGSDGMS